MPIGKKIALVQWAASAASTAERVLRPGPVIEGQHDLAFPQEVVALEMLEAEARTAGGVDLDGASDPQAHWDCRHKRRRRSCGAGGVGWDAAAALCAAARLAQNVSERPKCERAQRQHRRGSHRSGVATGADLGRLWADCDRVWKGR